MDSKSIWTRNFVFLALINLTTFLGFHMTTTGMPVYAAQLGATDLIAGLITTFVAGAALLIRPFVGLMLNRYGRRGILVSSTAAMAAIIAAYTVFPILGVILALRLLHGIAWGMSSTATATLAADIIPKQRFAEGMGYFALASALASALAPALSIAIIQSVGARPMIVLASAFTVLSLILAILQHAPEAPTAPPKTAFRLSDLFDKRALLPAAMMLLLNCGFASITTFITLHGHARGVNNIYLYFVVYAVVTIITRPVIGKMIDKIGFFMPGVLSTLSVITTLVIISYSTNIVMFCIAGIFAGLGFGTGMGTLQTMAVAAVPPERRGVATSTFLFGLDMGIAAGAAVAGAIADATGYATMYLSLTAFPIIACLTFLLLGKQRIARYSDS